MTRIRMYTTVRVIQTWYTKRVGGGFLRCRFAVDAGQREPIPYC